MWMTGTSGGNATCAGGAAVSQYCCWTARDGSGVGVGTGVGALVGATVGLGVGTSVGVKLGSGVAVGGSGVGDGVGGATVGGRGVSVDSIGAAAA
jgi:hypothetical protein